MQILDSFKSNGKYKNFYIVRALLTHVMTTF